jgi:hypothetical protein
VTGYSITRRVVFDVEFTVDGEVYELTEWSREMGHAGVLREGEDPNSVADFRVDSSGDVTTWVPVGGTWASQRDVDAVCKHLNEHGLPPDLGELEEPRVVQWIHEHTEVLA